MAQIWVSGYTADLSGNATITVTIDQLQQPDNQYVFYFKIGSGSWINNGQSSSYTFTGLSTGVSYTMSGKVLHAGTEYTIGSVSYTVPTPAQPPSTPTDFRASTGTSYVDLAWTPSAGIVDYYAVSLSNGSSKTTSYNTTRFTGLSSGTTYTAYLSATNSHGTSGTTSVTFTTDSDPTPTRPSNWSWTTAELSALSGGGSVTAITASRWNSFVSKMNEFRVYKGFAVYPGQVGSDKILYASLFRSVAVAIDAMRTLPTQSLKNVQTGDTLFGSYIIELTNTMNAIP